jgi:hypothetical protein
MKSFNDISINIFLGIFMLFLVEVIYIYYHHENKEKIIYISTDSEKQKIIEIINEEYERKNKEPIQINGIIKCSTSGALRGMLTGLLIGGIEGGVTGSIIMAVINPLIAGVEHNF